MTDDEKAPYEAKNKADIERYNGQLTELKEKGYFTTEDGLKSTDLHVDPKKKYGEDCLLPKKPLSAYLFYTTENVNLLKEKENCTHPEAMKKCGQMWNELSAEGRQPYLDMHEKDALRYKEQMTSLDTNGYFIMKDGTKSSDHKDPKSKKRAKKSDDKGGKAKKQKTE